MKKIILTCILFGAILSPAFWAPVSNSGWLTDEMIQVEEQRLLKTENAEQEEQKNKKTEKENSKAISENTTIAPINTSEETKWLVTDLKNTKEVSDKKSKYHIFIWILVILLIWNLIFSFLLYRKVVKK